MFAQCGGPNPGGGYGPPLRQHNRLVRMSRDPGSSYGSHTSRHGKYRSFLVPPPSTEIMSTIRLITRITSVVYAVSENFKLKQDVSVPDLREVLESYEEVREEAHVSVSMEWEKMCKAVEAVNLHKVVEVLASALKRRCEDAR